MRAIACTKYGPPDVLQLNEVNCMQRVRAPGVFDAGSTTVIVKRRPMRVVMRLVAESLLVCVAVTLVVAQEPAKPYVPIGIFLGRIEEGARIFTPVRLLPLDHPEAEGHQFPNALQLYGTELDVLLWLGHQAGYEMRSTLMRYPKEPSPVWPYKMFSPPDTSILRSVQCIRRSTADSPLQGLRAILFVNQQPVCFIVDTRNLTLEQRGIKKPTSMGLDINRSEFLSAIGKAVMFVDGQSTAAVIFEQ